CLRMTCVELKGGGDGGRDLGDLDRTSQAGPVMVAFVIDQRLRLVAKPAKRGRMDEAVAITAEIAPGRARRLGPKPAARSVGVGRIRRTRAFARHAALSTLE